MDGSWIGGAARGRMLHIFRGARTQTRRGCPSEREMGRLKLDVLGVGEVRWTGVGSVELPERG